MKKSLVFFTICILTLLAAPSFAADQQVVMEIEGMNCKL